MEWRNMDVASKRKRLQRSNAIDLPDISLETFLQHKADVYEKVDREIDRFYENKIKKLSGDKLWKKALHCISATHSLLAKDPLKVVLCGKADIKKIFEKCSPSVIERVKNVIEEYQGIYEEAFLLLNVPRSGICSYDEEKQARCLQLEHFYNKYLNGKNTEKYPAMKSEIKTYDDILKEMKHFMKYTASRAKNATVVYNGHGSPSGGLVLEGNEEHRSEGHSVSELLEDVYSIWNELHANEEDACLPARVSVVLAQCYGHKFEQDPDQKDVIKVISLSTDSCPETEYTVDWGEGRRVIDSEHVELSQFADQSKTGTEPEEGEGDLRKVEGAEAMAGAAGEDQPCADIFLVPTLFATISLTRTLPENNIEHFLKVLNSWRKEEKVICSIAENAQAQTAHKTKASKKKSTDKSAVCQLAKSVATCL